MMAGVEADEDRILAEIGEGASGVAAGKNIRQRIRGDTQSIVIKLDEAHRDLENVQDRLRQMAMDIQLLYNMSRERHMQMATLENKINIIGAAIVLMSVAFVFFVLS
jgi:hypothetical protein